MSTTAPTTQPPPSQNPRTTPLLHNASLLTLIVCPLLIALPPRKLDIYTLGLMTCTFVGGNHLAYEYTGVSMQERIRRRLEKMGGAMGNQLPDKAKDIKERLKAEMERKGVVEEKGLWDRLKGVGKKDEGTKGVLEEVRRIEEEGKKVPEAEKERETEEKRNILERVWMGNEGKDWKQKRDQREKEALEEGKGYGDLIMDQIWEVWNGGKNKLEEVKEIDEKVLEERKKDQKK